MKHNCVAYRIEPRAENIPMTELSENQLNEYKVDTKSRRAFLRQAFRLGGIGGLVFAAMLLLIVFYGFDLDTRLVVAMFGVAVAGFAFEYINYIRAKRTDATCLGCSTTFNKHRNSDCPDDTEYLYVCHPCKTYFKVLMSTAPTDYS